MKLKKSVPIVLGNVELVRILTRKSKGQQLPTKTTVSGIVFRNCNTSKTCPLVLQRSVRAMPSHLKNLKGWSVTKLQAVKHLGYSIPSNAENVGE